MPILRSFLHTMELEMFKQGYCRGEKVNFFDKERGLLIYSDPRRERLTYLQHIYKDGNRHGHKSLEFAFAMRSDKNFHVLSVDKVWTVTPPESEIDPNRKTVYTSYEGEKVTKDEKKEIKEHFIEAFTSFDLHVDVEFRDTPWLLYYQ